MYMYVALAVVLVAAAVAWWLRARGLPPGPLGLPVVGYLPFLDRNHPHLTLTTLADKYGPIYSLKMGNIFTVVLADAKLVRSALACGDFAGRAPLYLTHGLMRGNGIICVQGEKWQETRKFITTTLRQLGIVKLGPGRDRMEADVAAGVRDAVSRLRAATQPLDPEPLLFHTLGNVVFQLVFGVSWAEDDPTWQTLQYLQIEGTKYIGVAGAINFLPFLRFLPSSKKTIKFLEDGIAFTHEIYQDILQEYQQRPTPEIPGHIMGAYVKEVARRGDTPGHFCGLQFNFLMADMFGAGVDTTLTTVRWFMLYMALHPNLQSLAQQEIDRVTEGRPLALSHMAHCIYLEACICEAQRIRPVTPLGIPHGTTKETTVGGYRVPAGAMVVPLQWAIHHDPELYPDPDLFDPQRFLSTDHSKLVKPPHFLPFQAGKRICVGEDYARALLFLFGGSILQQFRVSLPEGSAAPDLRGEVGITLTPPHHLLHFSPRA